MTSKTLGSLCCETRDPSDSDVGDPAEVCNHMQALCRPDAPLMRFWTVCAVPLWQTSVFSSTSLLICCWAPESSGSCCVTYCHCVLTGAELVLVWFLLTRLPGLTLLCSYQNMPPACLTCSLINRSLCCIFCIF